MCRAESAGLRLQRIQEGARKILRGLLEEGGSLAVGPLLSPSPSLSCLPLPLLDVHAATETPWTQGC